MAGLGPLVSINDLKSTRLREEPRESIYSIRYDKELDTLFLRLVEPIGKTAVYFVDNYVGLIIEMQTLEVIGLQIEDFAKHFLPNHEGVERAWQLSHTGIEISNIGDFILTVEKLKPQVEQVAHEVMQAASEVVRPEAEALAEALEYA